MWPAKENGTRTVQAVHLFKAGTLFAGKHREDGQAYGRKGTSRGLGHSRGGDPRASSDVEPGADLAPFGHSSV